MKRSQLIEWALIFAGLITAFKVVELVLASFLSVVYVFRYSVGFTDYLGTFVSIGVYLAATIILLKNAAPLAAWIDRQSPSPATLAVRIHKHALLHVALIVAGIVTILTQGGLIVSGLVTTFKYEAGGGLYENPVAIADLVIVPAIRCVMGILLTVYAANLSSAFLKKEEDDPLVLESENTNPDNV